MVDSRSPPKKEERKKSKGRKGKNSLEEETALDNKFEESRDQLHFGGKFEESALDIPKSRVDLSERATLPDQMKGLGEYKRREAEREPSSYAESDMYNMAGSYRKQSMINGFEEDDPSEQQYGIGSVSERTYGKTEAKGSQNWRQRDADLLSS